MTVEKRRIVVLGILLVSIILIICAGQVWKSSLTVKNISIAGNKLVGTNEIMQLVGVKQGTLLFSTNLTEIQNNVMSHYYIKNAIVKRNLPHTIAVEVEERVPIAIVNSAKLYYVDDEGVVLPRPVSSTLLDIPLLSGVSDGENISAGSRLKSESIQEALSLLRIMRVLNRPLYHAISEVQVNSAFGIQLLTADNCVPIICGHGNIVEKFVKLEAFWNQYVLTRGTAALRYVDVRFTDRIIARWNKDAQGQKAQL